jgi:cytochrome c oxidase assembly protein subunit 20
MSDPKRTSGSYTYTGSAYNDQFLNRSSDLQRSSGSSTFASPIEPPPIPPPDYTKISSEEWARQKKPPLKGIIAEPEWRPSVAEAEKVLGLDKSSPSSQSQSPSDSSEQPQSSQSSSLYRKSGTSDILGRVAEAPDHKVYNSMPGGTRHSAGGEKLNAEPTIGDAIAMFSPVDAGKSLFQSHCFRTACMTSIASGFVIAGALWSVGKRARVVSNGAVVTFLATNVGSYTWCNRQREIERKTYRLVKEAWEEKMLVKSGDWDKLKEEKARKATIPPNKGSRAAAGSSWFWKSGKGREG